MFAIRLQSSFISQNKKVFKRDNTKCESTFEDFLYNAPTRIRTWALGSGDQRSIP